MKEERFFKEMPYPFSEEEERKLKKRVLSSIPEKRFNLLPKLVFVSGLIIIFLSIPFLIKNKPEPVQEMKKIHVQNPLKIKSEEIALKDLPFPAFKFEEKTEDIPFQITKINHSVKLIWEARGAEKFRVKKCYFPPQKEGCVYVEETTKNYFIDRDKEQEKLVIYIVEAVKG